MMKFLFAFVALLHVCDNAALDMNATIEILKILETFQEKNINATSTNELAPSPAMKKMANSCEGYFIKHLLHLLDNVTIPEEQKNKLEELKAILNYEKHQVDGQQEEPNCQMNPLKNVTKPFKQYIFFLRKLNSMRKDVSSVS